MRFIRDFTRVHCKRGPERCTKCRDVFGVKPALLEVADAPGTMARRIVELDGQHVEVDVVRWFDTHAEARAYAETHGIHIELSD